MWEHAWGPRAWHLVRVSGGRDAGSVPGDRQSEDTVWDSLKVCQPRRAAAGPLPPAGVREKQSRPWFSLANGVSQRPSLRHSWKGGWYHTVEGDSETSVTIANANNTLPEHLYAQEFVLAQGHALQLFVEAKV